MAVSRILEPATRSPLHIADADYVNEGFIGDSDDTDPPPICSVTHDSEPSLSRCSSANSLVSFVRCSESDTPTLNEEGVTNATGIESTDSLGWADHEHSSYLSSMEETFVRNMYDGEYCAVGLCGQAPYHVDFEEENCAESQPARLVSGSSEFKCFRRGDWRSIVFSAPIVPLPPQMTLLTNPWVKHFCPQASYAPRLASHSKSPSNVGEVEKVEPQDSAGFTSPRTPECVPKVADAGMWQEKKRGCSSRNRKRVLHTISKEKHLTKQRQGSALWNK